MLTHVHELSFDPHDAIAMLHRGQLRRWAQSVCVPGCATAVGVGELAYEQSPLVSVDVPQASFLLFRVARIHADSPEWGLCWETRQ